MKTSVEELIEFLTTHCNPTFCDIEYSDFILAIEQAKQKEREQMHNILMWYQSKSQEYRNDTLLVDVINDYYETTFKK